MYTADGAVVFEGAISGCSVCAEICKEQRDLNVRQRVRAVDVCDESLQQ